MQLRRLVSVALAALAAVPAAQAQEEYVNFEVPPIRALSVARFAGHDYLLVCNTADHALEVYDTVGNAFVQRIPVGLGPVSVVYHAPSQRVYTANSLGDSISIARLTSRGAGQPPLAILEQTTWVGDEPTDLVMFPDGRTLVVTLRSRDSIAFLDAATLEPIGGAFGARIPATYPLASAAAKKGLKEPVRLHWHGSNLLILAARGGNSAKHDFDALCMDLSGFRQIDMAGLGSANTGLVSLPDGRLVSVGLMARNEVIGETVLKDLPTGFVESRLYVVDGVGTPDYVVQSRDLNRGADRSVVRKEQALAHPTDVTVYDAGTTLKVFVSAYSSDRIGVLDATTVDPAQWPRRTIALQRPAGVPILGPRALALKRAAPGVSGDPGDRLYVLNQFANTVSVIDPAGEREVASFALRRDPEPADVKAGRRFLYSADLSGNGFVSCASCHIDGRTDGVGWNLGDPGDPDVLPYRRELFDGIVGPPIQGFPADKGLMVTQTLQGLVNARTNREAQPLFSNAPYHWRADRDDIGSFNGAFVNLLGGRNVVSGGVGGLTQQEMDAFEAFVNTIRIPPNPEQPLDRRYDGTLGDPNLEDGTGALRGLKLFHIQSFPGGIAGGRSCVHCHTLPEGSNRRLTTQTPAGPMETAQLRNLGPREARLETTAFGLSQIVTSDVGLTHDGSVAPSVNSFVFESARLVFVADPIKIADMIRFAREFDTGTAPIVGRSLTVRFGEAGGPGVAGAIQLMESQVAAANAGLAVHVARGGTVEGWFYDLTHQPAAYRRADRLEWRSRTEVLGLLGGAGDVLVFHATPLGTERGIAAGDQTLRRETGPAPDGITLEPMVPATPWQDVPLLSKNWRKGTGPNDFKWIGERAPGIPAEEPASPKAKRILQAVLSQQAPEFGVTGLRHEAPRRFRVAAWNVRQGARMVLRIPKDSGAPPPYGKDQHSLPIELPIFPTGEFLGDGRQVWETHAEASPELVLILLAGGPAAPGVSALRRNEVPEPPPAGTFAPRAWNLHLVEIVNEDGTRTRADEWQPLTVR